MKDTPEYWIERLELTPHPEGGYFKETHRSELYIPGDAFPERYAGPARRAVSTAIFFLLKSGQISHLHRLKSEEIWHFYRGSALTLFIISPDGTCTKRMLGPDPEKGAHFQALVPADAWFGATVNEPDSYTLVGCTVAPGFEFADFEMGDRKSLLAKHPQHREIIERLTKD